MSKKTIRKEVRLKADEWQRLQKAAKYHKKCPTTFLRQAALAYINGVYLLPDDTQLRHFDACLKQAVAAIHHIANHTPQLDDDQVQQLFDLLVAVEHSLHQIFHQPPQLKPLLQEIIDHHPKLHQWVRDQLESLVSNTEE